MKTVATSSIDIVPDEAMQEMARAGERLSAIASRLYEIGCDITAFGPFCFERIASNTGVSVLWCLEKVSEVVDELGGECAKLRSEYVAHQVKLLGIADKPKSLKLHIGAGPQTIPKWINIDVFPAELALNVNWGLPFPDNSASYVFLSHVLEHLYYPDEALALAREVRRVLAPGGVVRVIVPDIEQCIRAYVDENDRFFEDRAKTWTWWGKSRTRLAGFLDYAGAGLRPTSLLVGHKYGYDFRTLRDLLEQAGFNSTERSSYMQSSHSELKVDDHSSVAGATYGDNNCYYSLFVEAS